MLRKCVFSVLFLLAGIGATLADEMTGVIKTFGGDKLTFRVGKKDAETRTYDVAKDVKVFRIIKKNQKELDPDGTNAEPLPKLPKGGTIAIINVVDGKVTEISLPQKPKKP
jgi:hypothetical protein